jgi:hypothetical protein
MDVAVKGKIPLDVMNKWTAREQVPTEPALNGEAAPVDGQEVHIPAGDSLETKPRGKMKPWWKKPEGQKLKAPVRRVSIENVVSTAWGIGAMMLAKSADQRMLPVARVLDMQAPVAGIVVNEVAKGTFLDKALQPLARAGESGEKAAALLGPPVLVGAICLNPNLFPVIKPVLKATMISWLEVSEPAMKKAQARAARFQEKFGEIDLDAMIDALFMPPPGSEWAEAASPDEEDAIRRAKGEG